MTDQLFWLLLVTLFLLLYGVALVVDLLMDHIVDIARSVAVRRYRREESRS